LRHYRGRGDGSTMGVGGTHGNYCRGGNTDLLTTFTVVSKKPVVLKIHERI